jgi:hypothetical protein
VFFTDVTDERASPARGARHAAPPGIWSWSWRFGRRGIRSGHVAGIVRWHSATSAAAEELVAGRQAVLERMRRAGVTVLDVSPQAMTAAVVNKYLEIKGRGAL